MTTLYKIIPAYGAKPFMRNLTRAVAHKIDSQGIRIELRHFGSRVVADRRVNSKPRGRQVRHYNVLIENRSMPFVRGLTRSEARRVRAALRKVFKIKSSLWYWPPSRWRQD